MCMKSISYNCVKRPWQLSIKNIIYLRIDFAFISYHYVVIRSNPATKYYVLILIRLFDEVVDEINLKSEGTAVALQGNDKQFTDILEAGRVLLTTDSRLAKNSVQYLTCLLRKWRFKLNIEIVDQATGDPLLARLSFVC